MNINILKEAECRFLEKYPGGFQHPELAALGKKHKMTQLEALAKESFAKDNFANTNVVIENMIKLVSRSTMVSLFEKPRFRDTLRSLAIPEQAQLAQALFEILHGKEKVGFEAFTDILKQYKIAKWTLVTAIPAYYRPNKEVFIKPSTTKLVIDKLGLDLVYKPTPTWEFYSKYRKIIKELKFHVDKSIAPNNPAFCGFLMMNL